MNLKRLTHKITDSSSEKELWWYLENDNPYAPEEGYFIDRELTAEEAIQYCVKQGESTLDFGEFSSMKDWKMILMSGKTKEFRYFITISKYGKNKFDVSVMDLRTNEIIRDDESARMERNAKQQQERFRGKYSWAFK